MSKSKKNDIRKIDKELLSNLQKIRDWQDFTQGQVDALRVALFEIFHHVQADTALRAQVESHLEDRLLLMKEHQEPQGTIAGYESATKDLLFGFHVDNQDDKGKVQ